MKRLLVTLILISIVLVSCEKKSSQATPQQVTDPNSFFIVSPSDENILIPTECNG